MLLYADEDFPYPVVEELRRLGHDVLTGAGRRPASGARSRHPDPRSRTWPLRADP